MTSANVRDVLFEEPWSFSFFQAVRLLHRLDHNRKPLGRFVAPRDEVVSLSVPTNIAFPASEIQELTTLGSAAPEMAVNFLGLIGPQGVLPHCYSIAVEEAVRGRNRAAKAFFDIFQHRMLSHFYRAWEKSRPEVAYERGDIDLLEEAFRSIAGISGPGFTQRTAVSDVALIFYSGLLGPLQRSAIGLEQLLSDYFDLHVEVQQFSGGWFQLPPEALLRLGDDANASSQLGVGTVVGDAVWNEQASVRVRMGPLSREEFERFLPSGVAFRELQELVRFYADEVAEFEVQLVLRTNDVPQLVLGESALPLGWGTWVQTRPAVRDAEDVVISLQARSP